MAKAILFIITYLILLPKLLFAIGITVIDPIQSEQVRSSRVVLTYLLHNNTHRYITVEMSANSLGIDDSVGPYTHDQAINPHANSFKITQDKMHISPRRLNVPPGKTRPIRVLVNLKNLPLGTYYGNIKIAELPKKNNLLDENGKSYQDENLQTNLSLLLHQYVVFYLNKGKENWLKDHTKIQPTCTIDTKNNKLIYQINNTTHYVFKPTVEIIDEKTSKELTTITPAPALPLTKATRTIPFTNQLQDYSHLALNLKENNQIVDTIRCN